jgi:hypothetical protein
LRGHNSTHNTTFLAKIIRRVMILLTEIGKIMKETGLREVLKVLFEMPIRYVSLAIAD